VTSDEVGKYYRGKVEDLEDDIDGIIQYFGKVFLKKLEK
jgi:hypothetical protein